MNTKNILIYHHDDPDGFWSAASVLHTCKHGNVEFKVFPVNYGKDEINPEDIEWSDEVYVLDFTFHNMDEIVKLSGSKLTWIDHHKTAMEKFSDLWNDTNIAGIRSIEYAACMHTWKYLFPEREIPLVISHVADRDTWKFEYADTKLFCMAEALLIHNLMDENVEELLNYDSETIVKFYELGENLLKAQQYRVEKAFDRGVDYLFTVNECRYNARLVNTTTDISDIGEFIYKKPEYDIAIMWQAIENKMIFSLRSNSKDPNSPDVAKIAEQFGGGGHKNAAGFQVDGNCIFKIINSIV